MDMLCCSARSTSNLLERSGLFTRTDEEDELRVVLWEARAVATAPPKARLPTADQRAPRSVHSSGPHALRMHRPDAKENVRPHHASDAPRLGAQAGKRVLVRVQPRGKVPGNYAVQRTDDGPCDTDGDAEFNWRMRWPLSTMEKAPTLRTAPVRV